jgi:hypothetical protein
MLASTLVEGRHMSKMRWRVTAGNLRWVILASVGGVVHACGGKAEIEGDDVPLGQGGRAARGGAAGSVSAGTGGYGAGAGYGGEAGSAMAGAAGSGFAGSYNYPQPNYGLECDYAVESLGGWETCNNGIVHRFAQSTCPSLVPRAEAIDPVFYQEYVTQTDAGIILSPLVPCTQDSDCNERAYGHCELGGFDAGVTYCDYGCVIDSQCGAGQVCKCGIPVGKCVQAACTTDADCGSGLLCTAHDATLGCGGIQMACQTWSDECRSDQDCGGRYCYPRSGLEGRACVQGGCTIGRPFLVAGAERLACSVSRADWRTPLSSAARPALSPELSVALVAAFTQQGLMEHASIAAFARFSLQLLALGAPPELVSAAARAMQDETRHAQACFALASRHAGAAVGPGPLALDGALADTSWLGVVRDTILEGCIGETAAALEAAEAAAHCYDPDTRRVLLDIAREETQHAELAWRFVRWALAHGPRELHAHVVEVFRGALELPESDGAQEAPRLSAHEQALLENGVLCESLRAASRARALAQVVRPCVVALLERPCSERVDSSKVSRFSTIT